MSAATSVASVMADSPGALHSLQQGLLWLCVVGGVLVCAAILVVTLRHHRSKVPGRGGQLEALPSPAGASESRPGRARVWVMDVVWVMVPLVIVLGLGAWVVASHLGHPL